MIQYDERVIQPAHLCNLEVLLTHMQIHINASSCLWTLCGHPPEPESLNSHRAVHVFYSEGLPEHFSAVTRGPEQQFCMHFVSGFSVQWSVSSATSLIVVCLFLHFLHVPTFSELHFTAILEDGAIFNI